jgi:23S rRNA C2498 (ribose-2'-O)-methylase RlmM
MTVSVVSWMVCSYREQIAEYVYDIRTWMYEYLDCDWVFGIRGVKRRRIEIVCSCLE